MLTANKFGVKFPSYFEEHELLFGFGESVCYLVDDLLNRELIRRDYKFEAPIIPEDSDSDIDEREEAKVWDDQMILESNTQTNHNPDSPSRRTKVIVKNANAIESGKVTKTNFFTADSVSRTQPDEDALDLNESMISWKVDPDEWNRELEKVSPQLVLFEKEQSKVSLDPIEEFLLNLTKGLELMQKAHDECHKNSNLWRILNKVIDKLDGDLTFISKKESQMVGDMK